MLLGIVTTEFVELAENCRCYCLWEEECVNFITTITGEVNHEGQRLTTCVSKCELASEQVRSVEVYDVD